MNKIFWKRVWKGLKFFLAIGGFASAVIIPCFVVLFFIYRLAYFLSNFISIPILIGIVFGILFILWFLCLCYEAGREIGEE